MSRKFYIVLIVAALLCSGPIMAADWSGEGEVVEMGCYKSRNATGEGHAACAKTCFGKGAEMGLLTSSGDVVKLVAGDDKAPYEALIELAGKQVKVSGSETDGVVTVAAAAAAG